MVKSDQLHRGKWHYYDHFNSAIEVPIFYFLIIAFPICMFLPTDIPAHIIYKPDSIPGLWVLQNIY